MKILVVLVCSLMTLARGSLEPAGYKPPGTYHQTRYLPPYSSNRRTDNRYVSSSLELSGQNPEILNNILSRSLTLPLQSKPIPFTNYLPANRQASDQQDYESMIGERGSNVLPLYNRVSENQHAYTEALPRNDYYLSSSEKPPENRREQITDFFENYVPFPAKSYPSHDDGQSNNFLTNFSGSNDISPNERQTEAGSFYRQGKTEDSGSDYKYPSSHDNHKLQSVPDDYHYPSSENQAPAKYDFEYEVRDNNGNDYGHKEIRNGENTQGVYKVLLPDGRRQIVHYEADSHGYRPIITYEEAETRSDTRHSTRYDNQGYQY